MHGEKSKLSSILPKSDFTTKKSKAKKNSLTNEIFAIKRHSQLKEEYDKRKSFSITFNNHLQKNKLQLVPLFDLANIAGDGVMVGQRKNSLMLCFAHRATCAQIIGLLLRFIIIKAISSLSPHFRERPVLYRWEYIN